MKKYPLLLEGLILMLMLLIPAGSMSVSAAPPAQSGDESLIQIILVLDVSGSMDTPVHSGIVPEDLLALLLRLDELQNDPQFLELSEEMDEAKNTPEVLEAKDAYFDADKDLADWIASERGVSLPGIQAMIRRALLDAGCDAGSGSLIATAASADQIMFYLTADCPYTVNKWSLLEDLKEYVTYLEDPRYQELREDWQAKYRTYDQALEESGYASYSQQLEDYKASRDFAGIQAEIDRLVELYSIPSRLELAKAAALNLIDLSQLDAELSGRGSMIGLVTFSNQALLEHGMTSQSEQLKPLIQSMIPLEQTNIGDALLMSLSELETNADPEQPQLVILLSDGHTNVGLSSREIQAAIPPRANESEITICAAGFADIETEVDFLLLEGLAFETGGEYLFTNSGAELGSFFAACRESAAGMELAGQISGVLIAGDIQEIGRLEVQPHTCGLSLALNFLSGQPRIELVSPEGTVKPGQKGISYQSRNQVQRLSVQNPLEGEWIINLSNPDSQGNDALYSVIISTIPCQGPAPEVESTPAVTLPFFVSDRGLPVITAGLVILVLLLGAGVGFLILARQRRDL